MKNTLIKNTLIYNVLFFSLLHKYYCELYFPTDNEFETNYNLIKIFENGDEWEVVIQYNEYYPDTSYLDFSVLNKSAKEIIIMESEFLIQPEEATIVSPNYIKWKPLEKGMWNVTKYFNYRMQQCPNVGKENVEIISEFDDNFNVKSYMKVVDTDRTNWLTIHEYDEYSIEPMRMYVLLRNNMDIENKLNMQQKVLHILFDQKYDKKFIKVVNLENSIRIRYECKTYVSHSMLTKKVKEIVKRFENDSKYNVVLALLIIIIIIITIFILYNFRYVFYLLLEKYKKFT